MAFCQCGKDNCATCAFRSQSLTGLAGGLYAMTSPCVETILRDLRVIVDRAMANGEYAKASAVALAARSIAEWK